MGFIYKITNPSNKLYVGQTLDVKGRIDNYRSLRYRSKKSYIIDSIKKHGWDDHIFEVIESNVPEDEIDEREIFWIAELKTYAYEHKDGMNLTRGGKGYRHCWRNDDELVKKAKSRCGVNAPNYGKKIPQEVRDKIAASVSKYNRENGKKPSAACYEAVSKKLSIPVYCYNLSGEFIGEFQSLKFAAKHFGIPRRTANDALLGRQIHAHSVIFRKQSDGFNEKIDTSNIKFFVRKNCLAVESAG